jgi:glycosyltransferase involved in cell wall biosynthesis
MYPFSPADPEGPLTVGIIGTFSWQPTHRAANRVLLKLWPRIKTALPDARLLIVGRDARKFFSAHEKPNEIEIVENVPDIIPYFKRLHVLLYPPEHGSGVKVKVQEAMALGVPVVTTTDGTEGIPAQAGVHVGLSDDDAGLVARAIELLRDPAARRARRTAARTLIEVEFSPEGSVGAILKHHEAIVAHR